VGAGLGGGSADAAFTLMALADMFKLGLEDWQLADYAACLGSDCSFFIYNRPMFGEGRGDVLSDYEIDLSDYEIRVEVPEGVHVSTSEAYSRIIPRERLALPPLREALRYPVEMWPDVLFNDFESSVFPLYPAVEALKKRFYDEGAVYASMSGSGSAVFGLFRK
jgi:4-diphosphocytidyl-2-C-methyl-D-erythritol kinase